MMFWYGNHWAFWQMGLGWIGMILFWALLIWGAYVLLSNANRKSQGKDHEDDPRRILGQRLARGEIDAEEYQRLSDRLTSGAHHAPTGGGRT